LFSCTGLCVHNFLCDAISDTQTRTLWKKYSSNLINKKFSSNQNKLVRKREKYCASIEKSYGVLHTHTEGLLKLFVFGTSFCYQEDWWHQLNKDVPGFEHFSDAQIPTLKDLKSEITNIIGAHKSKKFCAILEKIHFGSTHNTQDWFLIKFNFAYHLCKKGTSQKIKQKSENVNVHF